MRLTGRIRLTITTAAIAVVVAAASTFAGQGEPPVPSAGSSAPASGGKNPVIHVPAVRADQTLVPESKGTPRLPTSALAHLDIPPTALLAYQRAAAVMAQADRSCRLPWTLLAAIGRVESDHGRYAGALLDPDGVSSPLIRGVALDGHGGVARVPDTDGGALDGDPRWDRAVGPMQFLPSTWSVVAVDADGDGIRSPDDLDDAALAAGVFLCSGPEDLTTVAGRSAAVLRYNPSRAYVASVLAVEHGYRTGDYTLQGQAPEIGPVQVAVNPHSTDQPTDQPTGGVPEAGAAVGAQPSAAGAPTRVGARRSGRAQASAGAEPSRTASSPPASSAPASSPPASSPSSPGESDYPSAPSAPSATSSGDPTDPVPTAPVPTESTGPSDPGTPEPPDPTTSAPAPSPDLVTLTGLLVRCGPEPGTVCLDDAPLDVGDAAYLAAPAAADLDADGTVESDAEELDGLVGTQVTLQVLADTSPALVVTVDELPYRSP